MNPWTFWWELWMRTAMAPFEAMATASRPSRPVPVATPPATPTPTTRRKAEGERHKEEFLARRLRTELEVKGPQGIIDEGGKT